MRFITKITSTLIFSFGLVNAASYSVDNVHTNVGFSVKHMMITNVKGEFKTYDAQIDFDEATKSFKTFSANVNTASVDTGIEKRDEHLRSDDFFASEKLKRLYFDQTLISATKKLLILPLIYAFCLITP